MNVIPWMVAASAGDAMFVQPLRSAIGVVARAIRRGAPRVRVPPMSAGWLRQYAADHDKHTGKS